MIRFVLEVEYVAFDERLLVLESPADRLVLVTVDVSELGLRDKLLFW